MQLKAVSAMKRKLKWILKQTRETSGECIRSFFLQDNRSVFMSESKQEVHSLPDRTVGQFELPALHQHAPLRR